MAKFELYAPILKKLEGGFVNNPIDKGGPTCAGVTLTTFRAYYGNDKMVKDLKKMTDEQWSRIMRTYWDECKADQIKNQDIANIVVDWNVNSGVFGRRNVQNVLGLQVDGIFGPKTLAALNAEPQKCIFCKIKDARKQYFTRLVQKNPSQAVFLKGWLNRVNTFTFAD